MMTNEYLICFNAYCVYREGKYCKYRGRKTMFINEDGKCNICADDDGMPEVYR